MHTYEPDDLRDMTPRQALDVVTADVRDHPITADGTGLFNAARHIRLLCHLTARLADDAEQQLAHPNTAGPSAAVLSVSSAHLGRAVAHFAQALDPLVLLVTAKHGTLQQQCDAIDHHRRLRVHLDDAGRALETARTALKTPPPQPPATAAAPFPAPSPRKHA